MTKLKFIKDHPSRRYKKGDIIEVPKESVNAWIKAGYCEKITAKKTTKKAK